MDIGAPELLLVFAVLLLLFGAKKLPDLARGAGRSLKIFKQEIDAQGDPGTKGAHPRSSSGA